MSIVTKSIGIAKKVKHLISESSESDKNALLSPVRRIERIKTEQRVCAMTFDDGPCRLPASPGGKIPLTISLLESLEKFGARGTFDIVGDTSANYPDEAGKQGSAAWGGVRYDHYPDIYKDSDGGAVSCPEIVERIISGGHEITNHTYSHVLFGKKNVVYGKRRHLNGVSDVIDDISRLHNYIKDNFGYEMTLSRPPHYVDSISGEYSSYDAYAATGYQYMAASYDGAGWLPLADYEAEVRAMWEDMERKLMDDPDYFCGQIIFQKDGYNMARRSPVADGLEIQLEILDRYNYKVLTVSELLNVSPFRDTDCSDNCFDAAKRMLEYGYSICYRDNTLRPEAPLTRGELAMMVYGRRATIDKITQKPRGFSDLKTEHPYAAAAITAVRNGSMASQEGKFHPNHPVTKPEFEKLIDIHFPERKCISLPDSFSHAQTIILLDTLASSGTV